MRSILWAMVPDNASLFLAPDQVAAFDVFTDGGWPDDGVLREAKKIIKLYHPNRGVREAVPEVVRAWGVGRVRELLKTALAEGGRLEKRTAQREEAYRKRREDQASASAERAMAKAQERNKDEPRSVTAGGAPEKGDIITLPVSQVLTSTTSYESAQSNIARGRGSRTEGPISVWLLEDGRFLLVDGQHRFAQAVQQGLETIEAEVVGEGYSDTWSTPAEDRVFKLNSSLRPTLFGARDAAFVGRYWVAPDGTVFKVMGDHGDWAQKNISKIAKVDAESGENLRLAKDDYGEGWLGSESSGQDARAGLQSAGWLAIDYDSVRMSALEPGLRLLRKAVETLVPPEYMDSLLFIEADDVALIQTTPRKVKNRQVQANLQASDGKFSWSCLMIDYPEALANRVTAWSKTNISDDLLYDPKDPDGHTYGRESHCHTTVGYGLDPEMTLKDLKVAVLPGLLHVRLGKISKFDTDPAYDVIKIEVESPDLHALNKELKDTVGLPGNTFPDYRPHLTIAYVLPGSCDHLLGDSPFEGEDFTIEDYDFSDPNGSHEKFEALTPKLKAEQESESDKAWVSPEGKVYFLPHSYSEHSNSLDYPGMAEVPEVEETGMFALIKAGWSRVGLDSFVPALYVETEKPVAWVLAQLPQEMRLVKALTVDSDTQGNWALDVLEDEDALDAWNHRKDIRHRVAAAPQGITAGLPLFHRVIFAAPQLNELVKLARTLLEEDPRFAGYQQDPKKAETLGAAQQALSEARSEAEVQQVWQEFGTPGLSFEQLKTRSQTAE